MKTFYIFLWVLLISGIAIQFEKSKKTGLFGKVKSVKETRYFAQDVNGVVVKGGINGRGTRIFKFDTEGNNIEMNRYDSDGAVFDKTTYRYDSKGNLLVETLIDNDGSIKWQTVFKYNERGKKIDQRYYDGVKLSIYIIFDYDKNGNIVQENHFRGDSTLKEKMIYKYDEFNNMVEEAKYDSDNVMKYRHSYEYDEKGNKIEGRTYHANDVLQTITTYKFDNSGNMIEKLEKNYIKTEYLRTQGITLTRTEIILDDPIITTRYFKYDSKGNTIEMVRYNHDGILEYSETSTYEYDKKGNWIKQTVYNNAIPEEIIERKIEYFPE